MTHNENTKTFNDIEHHLEFEAEHLEVVKPFYSIYMVELSSRKASDFMCKKEAISITKRVRDLILIKRS